MKYDKFLSGFVFLLLLTASANAAQIRFRVLPYSVQKDFRWCFVPGCASANWDHETRLDQGHSINVNVPGTVHFGKIDGFLTPGARPVRHEFSTDYRVAYLREIHLKDKPDLRDALHALAFIERDTDRFGDTLFNMPTYTYILQKLSDIVTYNTEQDLSCIQRFLENNTRESLSQVAQKCCNRLNVEAENLLHALNSIMLRGKDDSALTSCFESYADKVSKLRVVMNRFVES